MAASAHTRVLAGIFALIALAGGACAWMVHSGNVQRELRANAERKVSDIADVYLRAEAEYGEALRSAAVGSEQQAAVRKLSDVASDVREREQPDLLVRIQDVTRLQVSGLSLLATVTERQEALPAFSALREAFGEHGIAEPLIVEYNALARSLNRRSSSFLGSVAADVANQSVVQLPYLRVDGRLDDVMSIEL